MFIVCLETTASNVSINTETVDTSAKTVARRCSVRKVFLEISQNSQENTCARMKTPLVAASELK